jgi:glycosyltransferase involved in cell wall biosynthesis
MKISYAIPVCNEHKELERLLDFLELNLRKEDEVVVQCDKGNTTSEVYEVINSERYSDGFRNQFKVVEFPLNGNFSSFKNNLTESCTGDYIYQIDADEMVNEYVLRLLPQVLEQNDVDVLMVSRINTVEGITQEHIDKWGWKVTNQGWINFPDPQFRIYRNNGKIKWKNKVHEVLEGYKTISHLPTEEEWCLIHEKTINRQEKQNEFYNTI